jgi:hypothetical protein
VALFLLGRLTQQLGQGPVRRHVAHGTLTVPAFPPLDAGKTFREEVRAMPNKRPSVKNEKQYERLKEKGMSKERAARIANSPGASSRGGKKSGSGGRRSTRSQGGTTAQKKAAGRKGGRAAARKS